MNDVDICSAFNGGLESLFDCQWHGEHYRIRTPYLYPDGDNIDVFCKSQAMLRLYPTWVRRRGGCECKR